MPTKEEALAELYRRGKLNDRQMAAVEELAKRGRIQLPQAAPEPGQLIRSAERSAAMAEMAEEVGPLQAFMIGAGKGMYTVGRGLGLAEPAGPAEQEAMAALQERRPYTTGAGEIVGEAAPFLPAAVATGGLAALPARMAAGGLVGAAEAGTIARGMGDETATAAITGGAIGLGAEILFPVIGRLGRKVFERVTGRTARGAMLDAAGRPTQELQEALDAAGMSFEDLTQDAAETIGGVQPLKPEQVARSEFLKSKGVEPTQAQITREASEFQAQQEAAKTSTRVRKRLEQQEAALISGFDEAISQTGGTAVQSGSPVVDRVLGESLEVDKKIGQLYTQARERTAGAPAVSLMGLSQKVQRMMPDNRLMRGVPESIKGQLVNEGIMDAEFKILREATVDEAERIRKVANSVYSSTTPYGKRGLKEIKDQIDFDVTKSVGEDLYKEARGAKAAFEKSLSGTKASKFSTRSKAVLRDIIEDKIDPNQFFDKTVLSKSVRDTDLKDIKRFMLSGPNKAEGQAALNDLKAETMQWVKDQSFKGPLDASGNQAMTRASLENALKKIGPEKMKVLFEPEEIKFFDDMITVSQLREPVRGTALGRGPSAQAVSRIEGLLKKMPIFGGLFEFIDFDAQGRAMIKAKPEKIFIPRTTTEEMITGAITAGAPALGVAAIAEQEGTE